MLVCALYIDVCLCVHVFTFHDLLFVGRLANVIGRIVGGVVGGLSALFFLILLAILLIIVVLRVLKTISVRVLHLNNNNINVHINYYLYPTYVLNIIKVKW